MWFELVGYRIPHFIFGLLFTLLVSKEILHALTAGSLTEMAALGTEKGRAELRETLAKLREKQARMA